MAFIGALAGLAIACPQAHAGVGGFEREPLEIFDHHLFDLGAADHDDDGDLDLYTLNHLERQSLLSNDGSGAFTERLYEAGLGQTRAIPGWEDPGAPQVSGPGLYISAGGGGMTLRHVGRGRVEGSVEFLFDASAASTDGARARVVRRGDRYLARFAMKGDSRVRLAPERLAHPFVVHLRAPFPLDRAFVGALEQNPGQRKFVLYKRDRHGIAWADVSTDRRTDAFIVRGGLRGKIKDVIGEIQDELLFQGPEAEFSPRGDAGLRKGRCRGRGAGAVDFNADGRLDLFATCKKDAPKLYSRSGEASFTDASADLRQAGLRSEVLRFLDLADGPAPEILAVTQGGFEVYRRGQGGWRLEQRLAGRHGPQEGSAITTGDPDRDGDPDVYVASSTGSTFLRNRDGRLDAVDPGTLGLPRSGIATAWTDFDNDGRLDLHVVPAGLFRARPSGGYTRVGTFGTVEDPAEARLAWPDLDNDGDRDVVLAARSRRSPRNFRTYTFENGGQPGNWLEVSPVGKRGNPQAIGARVAVRTGEGVQTGWVGQSESSVFSQGHYRLYFGLGSATSAQVRVRWPGGRRESVGSVAADQILRPRE